MMSPSLARRATMKRVAVLTTLLVVASLVLVQPAAGESPPGVPNRLQLVEATVDDLQLALRSRLITSEQLVQMYLNRIAAYDDAGPTLNSFIHLNPRAVDEARARDRDRS